MLFKNEDRYDELKPPFADDGPAPGPGKCGGFEVNLSFEDGAYLLQRFNAETQTYDVVSKGTMLLQMDESLKSEKCPLSNIKKEMVDVVLSRGEEILASGSFAAVSGLQGLPEGASLAIAGNLELSKRAARGGPKRCVQRRRLFSFFFILFFVQVQSNSVGPQSAVFASVLSHAQWLLVFQQHFERKKRQNCR